MEQIIKIITSKHFFKNFIAFHCIAFGFTYIMLMTFLPIPTDNIRFADTSLGFVLGSILSTVITYYLGGSKGSSDKTDILNKMTEKSNGEPTT